MSTVEATPIESARALATPELLAPAGDRTCMIAAIENGADAVYFGLHGHGRLVHEAALDVLPLIGILGATKSVELPDLDLPALGLASLQIALGTSLVTALVDSPVVFAPEVGA